MHLKNKQINKDLARFQDTVVFGLSKYDFIFSTIFSSILLNSDTYFVNRTWTEKEILYSRFFKYINKQEYDKWIGSICLFTDWASWGSRRVWGYCRWCIPSELRSPRDESSLRAAQLQRCTVFNRHQACQIE